MERTLLTTALILGLLSGSAEAHLSVVCSATSKQQPNTFAFWFITYYHVGSDPRGQVHIQDPSARVISSPFSNVCKPSVSNLPNAGSTVQAFEDVLKTHCLDSRDLDGKVPIFPDSAVECYNADTNTKLPNYAVGLRGDQMVTTDPSYQNRKMVDYYFVVVDNQFVETGSYKTHFTNTDQNLDPCNSAYPCSLTRHAWTFEISVITGPPRCTTPPPPSVTGNVVPASLSSCDGSSRVIEAGTLCHAQCSSGFEKIGILECIDQEDGTAAWNPDFTCSSSAVCQLPASGNNAAIDAGIVGVASPCSTLNIAGTKCFYTCSGFDNQQSAGKIKCETNGMGEGVWVPDPDTSDYDACSWTVAPTPQPTPVPTPAPTPAPVWEAGCFADSIGNRLLPHLAYKGDENTLQSCSERCHKKNYAFSGVQFGEECWCGNDVSRGAHHPDEDCEELACTGDSKTNCGGRYRMKVFQYTAPAPVHTPVWEGCYKDSSSSRRLTFVYVDTEGLTNEVCATVCQARGYTYSGTQAGRECWCGNDLSTSTRADPARCSKPCPGDGSKICGGSYANTIYSLKPLATPMTPALEGCFKDSSSRRFPHLAFSSSKLTVGECSKTCWHNGYTYAAMQWNDECRCGNDLSTSKRTTISECSEPCLGDNSEACGGSYRNRVYAVRPVPAKDIVSYVGCFKDYHSNRQLGTRAYKDRRGNTVEECTKTCQHNGYKYAGVQYSSECWCGNSTPTSPASEGRCSKRCSGDSSEFCGGGWHMSLYLVQGV